ncbi:MAG: retropepsin-like aspartic protease [Mangrovibacterium sp.]
MRKINQLIIMLLVAATLCVACNTPINKAKEKEAEIVAIPTINYDALAEALQTAFQTKDTALITPFLSPNFTVSTQSWPASAFMLQQIVLHSNLDCKVEFPKKELVKADVEDGLFNLPVNYVFKDTTQTSNIVFTADGKILYLDFFDQRYGLFRNRESKLVDKIPFEFKEGKIIVKLRLNDNSKELNFLFDTGADGMAIPASLAKEVGLKVTRRQSTSVVGAHVDVQISSGNTVHLGKVSIPNRNIAIFNSERDNTDGIIGITLANNYIVKVNFDESVIYLYSLGNLEHNESEKKVSVIVPRGLAIVHAGINLVGNEEVPGNFIFDTGANYNLVCFNNYVRKHKMLVSGFKYDDVASMVSMGQSTVVYNGRAKQFYLGNKDIVVDDMPVTLQASSGNSSWNPSGNGSLGIRFMKDYNFTLDLTKRAIYFDKRGGN